MKPYVLFVFILMFPAAMICYGQAGSPSKAFKAFEDESTNKITILWISGDRNVFMESIEPYCNACFKNKDYDELTLMAWGSSICLLAKDKNLQRELKTLINKGLDVKASRFLTEKYSCTEILKNMGVEIGNMNEILTDFLKDKNRKLVSL